MVNQYTHPEDSAAKERPQATAGPGTPTPARVTERASGAARPSQTNPPHPYDAPKRQEPHSEPPRRWFARLGQSEKGRWALTVVCAGLLIAVFTMANPQIWQGQSNPDQDEQHLSDNQISQPGNEGQPQGDTPSINNSGEPVQAQDEGEQEPTTPATDHADESEATSTTASGESPNWLQPASGEWTRLFGFAYDPTRQDYRFHEGLDMPLAEGSPIGAAASGTVISATEDELWGGVIVLEHSGGWLSIYKCLTPAVTPGQSVAAGEVIGNICASPPAEASQESHLHFEMHLNEEAEDPLLWLPQ